jgi:hypothetical protein
VIHRDRYRAVDNQARGVVTRQPARNVYSHLRGYCSILTFSCRGKAGHKGVAQLLAAPTDGTVILYDGHYRGGTGWSAIDQYVILVARAYVD